MYYRVLASSQRYHGSESLIYESDKNLEIGQIVAVPLQSKSVMGIVEAITTKPTFKTKGITRSWEIYLPKKSFILIEWLKKYYPAPLGILTGLFTPPDLPKKLPTLILKEDLSLKISKLPTMTKEQRNVVDSIDTTESRSILLHGNTGSGKTRVYIELTKKSLDQNRSVIILTPEIGLTGVLMDSFFEVFGDRILLTHSDMTPKERRSVWIRASRSNKGIIVIGPRSAIFTPLNNIGLIIMDEAHDGSYKQEKSPNYQTSRVAAKLANIHNANFIMGTATPLISDYFTFQNKNLAILRMTKLATRGLSKTNTSIIDLRLKENFTRSPWIANQIISSIESALKQKEQTLLYLNRRGSARLVLCSVCGWHAACPHCDVSLTFHHDSYNMLCHSCNFKKSVPTSCPECGDHELLFKSIGTKTLEVEVAKLFPGASISRFDGDTTKQLSLNQKRKDLQNGKIDILIGTQSIVKGFDLPKLSVVGVIQADSSLQIPDYTASELTYQLISQVSGRISRGHRHGSLFIQTYDPGSRLIEFSLNKDYEGFNKQELEQRKKYNFPPYTFLLKVNSSRSSSQSAYIASKKLSEMLRIQHSHIKIEGPSPRFIEKVAGRYTWHLIVKSKNRNNLLEVIHDLPSNCTYDIDPTDLL